MVPPGGSATLYGVLYQLLGSLHHTVRLRVQKRGEKTVLGARLTVEPPKGGGDLWIELPEGRFAEQWKARTSGLPWGLQEILDKVIPDLYLDPALNLPDDRTKYVFATEGRVGPKARAFFQRLSGPMPEKDPLAGLGREDRKLFRDTARGVQKRMRARSEKIELIYRKLRRLLNRFEIRDNQEADRLVWEIDRWLLALIDHIEDIPATRDQLCTILLRRGTGKNIENEFMPEDLLREAGLSGVSLKDEDELRHKVREVLDREVARRKYDRTKDVRDAPDLPQGKGILFLSGESGQGKTWQTARLALDRAEGGRLTVIVDSAGEAERDLQRASDRFWKEAWGRNRPLSLDQLVERWRQVKGDDGRVWLTICVENVESQKEARALLRDYDWERWGVELVLTGSPQIGDDLAEENPERVHHVRLRDFTPAELREYLRRHGRSWETVPADVRDTLKRPLLAGLYTSLSPDPDFAPVHEYRLYEKSWQKIGRDLIEHPEDLDLLKGLTLTLLDEEPHYPWTLDQLRNAGVSSETRARLEKVGWWSRNEEGRVEVWHDRMLSWVLSQALAEQGTVANLTSQLNRRSTNPRIRRILAYLLMDVLWILSGNPARSHLVPDLLVSLEEYERPFGYHRLYQAGLLPTLGLRIIPGLIERLRRLPDRARYSYMSLSVEALSKILDKEPEGRADLPACLSDPSSLVRNVTVKVLARHPHAVAIDLLWNLLREKSLQIEETKGKEGRSDRQSAFAALRACLELNPEWLRFKIQGSKPETEPVWELAYLLANIKHPAARSIWMDVKKDLLEKVRPGKLHSLMVCIRVFRDAEEIPRLEEWLPLDEKWTSNTAFEGIARIDPERAVFLLKTVPLGTLLASSRGWFPILLLNRPEDTRRALRERMKEAGAGFWRVANLYRWYEERMDRETVEALLDRLVIEATEALQGREEARNHLRRSLHLLSRIHRVDLLECFQARSGTDLERGLGELGAASVGSLQSDLEELRSVLLKIGGEGFRRLIQVGLASCDLNQRADAMFWGLVCPEEIAANAAGETWVAAAVGEDRALVVAVMGWDTEVENDDLTELWRLRRWKPPMSDADLAPALEGLRSTDPQQRVRGMAAISISGRADLLSHLPEWLEGTGSFEQESLETLDERAAHLVYRLAGGNQEGTRGLARSLDVRRFPWTAAQLLYEIESQELADRLEADLLERWTSNGRLQESEMDVALHLAQFRRLPDPLLRALWENGKDSLRMSSQEYFYPVVARIESEEVRERIWNEAFEARDAYPRTYAIRALHSLDSEEALRAARRGLENPEINEREAFVSLLFEIGGPEAVPWLVEQAMREKKTEVRWEIARTLRRAGAEMQAELRMRLESPDFRVRSVAAHLAGWQGVGFMEADLQRMAEEDPDDDVQWECLQALARQRRERCVVGLVDAFRRAQGITRWSYLESILELGDPRLLVTEEDALWLGRILTPELGQLEVHANFRLKKRFDEIKRAAERRDSSHED